MKICVYLPKREELSLRTVLAFPKDSSRGVASSICVQSPHTEMCFVIPSSGIWNKMASKENIAYRDLMREEEEKEKD